MIFKTLQYVIISLSIIAILHYLFSFFKTNLTVPKVKDLIERPTQQYETILDAIKERQMNISKQAVNNELRSTPNANEQQSSNGDSSNIGFIPEYDSNNDATSNVHEMLEYDDGNQTDELAYSYY